jgi:hypothetical protein
MCDVLTFSLLKIFLVVVERHVLLLYTVRITTSTNKATCQSTARHEVVKNLQKIIITSLLFSSSYSLSTPTMKSFVGLLLAVLTASALSFTATPGKSSYLTKVSTTQLGMSATERTYIMVKPDGVQRGLVGNIISRFETKGYKMVAIKTRMATQEILDEHYKDLVKKPFFPKLREYLLSGPVVSMCWEGKEAGK